MSPQSLSSYRQKFAYRRDTARLRRRKYPRTIGRSSRQPDLRTYTIPRQLKKVEKVLQNPDQKRCRELIIAARASDLLASVLSLALCRSERCCQRSCADGTRPDPRSPNGSLPAPHRQTSCAAAVNPAIGRRADAV
jgi:hypothetical protein